MEEKIRRIWKAGQDYTVEVPKDLCFDVLTNQDGRVRFHAYEIRLTVTPLRMDGSPGMKTQIGESFENRTIVPMEAGIRVFGYTLREMNWAIYRFIASGMRSSGVSDWEEEKELKL